MIPIVAKKLMQVPGRILSSLGLAESSLALAPPPRWRWWFSIVYITHTPTHPLHTVMYTIKYSMAESAPPPIWGTFSTLDPKNGSQPQNSPRLRYYNTKRTQKLCETCRNRHLSVSWNLPSFCSWQGPPLWNWANFDHFCPLPARPNVIWLQKIVSNTPFTYLGKEKKIGNFSH